MAGEGSSYVMATEGVNSFDSFLIAVDGEFDVIIEDITPEEVEEIIQGGGYVDPWTMGDYGEEPTTETPKKKITVCTYIDGQRYCETRYTQKEDVKVEDVKVEVKKDDKPSIEIKVI